MEKQRLLMLLKGCWSCRLDFQSLIKIELYLQDKYDKKHFILLILIDIINKSCYIRSWEQAEKNL